jgi:tetratricopeptide (TPR) repeat protein
VPGKMRRKLVVGLLLAAALLPGLGCNGRSTAIDPPGEYRTITADPRRDTAAARRFNQTGLEHLTKGEIAKAIDAFKAALTADVTFGPAHNNLGKAYYLQQDYYQAAWEFEYAIKQMPGQPQPHNNLGLVYEAVNKLDEAVQCYDQALRLDAQNPEYLGNAARARVRRGDRDDDLRELLTKLILRDTRPEWVSWARRTLALLPNPTTRP